MSIEFTSTVDAPIDEVFDWFGRPGALRRLLPPWQPMRAMSEAGSLADGRAVLGLPAGLVWHAQHMGAEFSPPHRFVDERVVDGPASAPAALAGPWRHVHDFREAPGGGTVMIDRVRTPVPEALLRSTFEFRHRQVADDLAAHRTSRRGGLAPSTIAVTGASGLVGSALCAFLSTGGHRVIRLVRRAADGPNTRLWDPASPASDLLDDVDAVVHLAGEPIAGRFTDGHKAAIRDSRVEPTRRLADLAAASPTVRTFVSASAIGFYGFDRPDAVSESSSKGGGFLADVVDEWERAARVSGVRSVHVRTGIVQSPLGGTLRLQRPIYAAGLGGRIGTGRQRLSWIDLDDLLDVYLRALFDDRLDGPVNAVAPGPVTAQEYAATLGRVLRRPAVLPVPAFGPALLLGRQGARELAAADQHVSCGALDAVGHTFRHPTLEASLRHQLGR
ncbi:nucleoside-diphosphate sugar epimerase [Gordonia spumicola]|uniref:Nucleoside-diphosphate sugar epimerase n=1 Tax=Gordonia spumicola TaxID=589161 RepID=A0A7I9V3N4_9ACTN|nr:TIGR01777 family oxidoreductase [Gordonia spumicola]GED99836.1 nucleoside-diphosphate sugar epimerase [Gordonia spumicola]